MRPTLGDAMSAATDDITTQLALWGWVVTTGTGTYPTPRDQWEAERMVAIMEGCEVDGQFDLGAVDLMGCRRFHGDREVPVPESWALVGHSAWVMMREDA